MPTSARAGLTAFISYSTLDGGVAEKVKAVLSSLHVQAFLAHEDIQVSEEWRKRIIRELRTADIFIALLSRNFRDSEWTAQELGFAISRKKVLLIPVSLDGTQPFGLAADFHGKPLPKDVTRDFFVAPIAQRFPREIIPVLIADLSAAGDYRGAEALMQPLVPLFDRFSDEEVAAFASASIRNGQIWNANLCRNDYLPKFIRINGSRVEPGKLVALRHQITVGGWYNESEWLSP